jgi:hypothetical protein
MDVKVGRVYRHFKGDHYLVEGIAINSENEEKMVIYRQLYGDGSLYVRPYNMFLEKVNKNNQEYRFELVDIESVVWE